MVGDLFLVGGAVVTLLGVGFLVASFLAWFIHGADRYKDR